MIEELHILSSYDKLTGVLNRNEMNHCVLHLTNSHVKESVGVLFVDLNGLKIINDSKGHIAGDTLLKNAASALKELFPHNQIFRAGGDEFVVILTGLSKEELLQKAEQLRETADKYDGVIFAIGAAYEENVTNINTALHNADECMYEDKKHYYKLHPEMKRSVSSDNTYNKGTKS